MLQRRALGDRSEQEYYVYRSARAGATAPIFVSIHHNSREAAEVADAFRRVVDRYGAVLIAPQFPADRHPNFQRLGASRHPPDRGRRADAALEAILSEAREQLGLETERIHLFGYGAGGRFVMRYAMAHPDRVAGVVIASPGSYTPPDPKRRFPLGIGPRPSAPDLSLDPERFLRVPMTVFETRSNVRRMSPRRVEAERSPKTAKPAKPSKPRGSGLEWVAAMKAAAGERQIESRVVYRVVQGQIKSFRDFVERAALPERTFEALLGEAPQTALSRVGDAMRRMSRSMGLPWETVDADDPEAKTLGDRRRRTVLIGVLAAAALAIATPVALWLDYRASHVVSREAVVRGHIAEVGSRLEGVVQHLEVEPGDRVVAGQVIARLEDSHIQAGVRQARSQLEKATRELEVERLAIINERQRLRNQLREVSAQENSARADYVAAQSMTEEAQRRLELQESLAAKGLLAEEQVRIARTEHRTARARLGAASADRNAAEAARERAETESEGLAVREKRISVLESEIAALQAELHVAEANLEGSVIRAPGDGVVVRRIVEPGGATVTGQPIVSIWVGDRLWVEAWIDEEELGLFDVGNEATVTFNSFPGREFKGRVERISASTDFELPDSDVPQPRDERMRDAPVIAVRVRLDDTVATLFPGLSAVVGIRKTER